MRNIKFLKYTLTLLFVLSGCAYPDLTKNYTPQKPTPKKALVYIYRNQAQVDSANFDVPRFYINDQLVGKLLLGGYYVQEVEPGKVVIYSKESALGIPFPWKALEVAFEAKANHIYFVKFRKEFGANSGIGIGQELKLVPQAQAGQEIAETQLLEP
ncbi:hypothetical protein D3C87_102880 [compost metagenome]